jgi:hypothetical protein
MKLVESRTYAVLAIAASLAMGTGCPGSLTTDPQQSGQGGSGRDTGGPSADAGGGGDDEDGGAGGDAGAQGPEGCGVQEMFEALEPDCVSCHRQGNTPYFASGTSFYNLLVLDPKWVTPGDPDGSGLVAILEGRAPEPYPQMPVGGKPFAELEAEGNTTASMQQVRTFITELDGCRATEQPARETASVQRKSAHQIYLALKAHIGLDDEDIVSRNSSGGGSEERYPIWSPDNVLRITNNVNLNVSTTGSTRRWYALGGESYLGGVKANRALSPTFGQTMVQVSQAWCRIGVEKDGNAALFRHVDQASLGAAAEADVKANIRYLMLRFWGHDATAEEVDAMHDGIYATYAASADPETAWVAVCASLIRDPLWLVY